MAGGSYDGVVVGAGPNGLAAAITLARAGRSVLVLEAEASVGGGARSAELTLPGFVHDVCSAIHPLGIASPFFKSLPLGDHGLEWIHPRIPLAHPLDDGTAVELDTSIEGTVGGLWPDGAAWERLMKPLVDRFDDLLEGMLVPLVPPRHPFALARFGWHGMRSGRGLAETLFQGERARALFGGLAAHAIVPLEKPFTASFGLTLALLAHTVGWPLPRGGSQRLSDALASYLKSLGGEIQTGRRITSVNELPKAKAVFFDITPRQLIQMAGDRLPVRYRRKLERFRYGDGVFKVDWALRAPVPWKAAACARSGTVHLGGTLREIAAAERATARGALPEQPFVLFAQQSLFDSSRAPQGHHTAWGYCHVPNGSAVDMTDPIERQVERFAPGFRDLILARHVMGPAELVRRNANCAGGDITGGSNSARQLFFRPTLLAPYTIPVKGWYLCSASTPPGGGVHGMCGFNAAREALRRLNIG